MWPTPFLPCCGSESEGYYLDLDHFSFQVGVAVAAFESSAPWLSWACVSVSREATVRGV